MGTTLARGPCRRYPTGFLLHGPDRNGWEGTGQDGIGLDRIGRGMPSREGHAEDTLRSFFCTEGSGMEWNGGEGTGVDGNGHDPLARAMQKTPCGVSSAWSGAEGKGSDWIGLDRIGMGMPSREGHAEDILRGFFCMERTGVEWRGSDWSGRAWAYPRERVMQKLFYGVAPACTILNQGADNDPLLLWRTKHHR